MTRVFNRAQQTSLRRRGRKDAPKAERLLWWRLRRRQLDGLKFRRQYGVGAYVVDFYCVEAKLAVEIDGEAHFDPVAERRDAHRQASIEAFGIHVLRFTNPQVYDKLDAVIEEVWAVAQERMAQLAKYIPVSTPRKAEGRVSPLGIGLDDGNSPESPLVKGGGS